MAQRQTADEAMHGILGRGRSSQGSKQGEGRAGDRGVTKTGSHRGSTSRAKALGCPVLSGVLTPVWA